MSTMLAPVPNPKTPTNLKPLEIAREYFPDAEDAELEHIVEGETGWPAFWRIPEDGNTPEECFRNQLLIAVARRKIRYLNLEIVENDPYAGVVEKLKLKAAPYGRLKIELFNGAYLECDSETEEVRVVNPAGTCIYQNEPVFENAEIVTGHRFGGGLERIRLKQSDRYDCVVAMPDGATVYAGSDGTTQVNDADATIIYKANRVREFNPFLNTSDQLEAFIAYLGTLGVRQRDIKDIGIDLFMKWLVIQAAKHDGDDVPDQGVLNQEILQRLVGESPDMRCDPLAEASAVEDTVVSDR